MNSQQFLCVYVHSYVHMYVHVYVPGQAYKRMCGCKYMATVTAPMGMGRVGACGW